MCFILKKNQYLMHYFCLATSAYLESEDHGNSSKNNHGEHWLSNRSSVEASWGLVAAVVANSSSSRPEGLGVRVDRGKCGTSIETFSCRFLCRRIKFFVSRHEKFY